MTLVRRLVLGVLAITIPGTMVLGAVTLHSLRSLDGALRELHDITQSLETTRELHIALLQAQESAAGYLVGGAEADRREFYRRLARAETVTASCGSSQCHGSQRTPEGMVAVIGPAMTAVRTNADRVFAEPADGTSPATRLLPIRAGIATVESRLQPMSAMLRTRVDGLTARVEAIERTAFTAIGALTVALILGASAGAAVFARRIVQPVRALLVGTDRVKAGDWSVRVREGRDEIGLLGASFNAMVEDLRRYRERVEDDNATLEARVRQRTEELERKDRALVESKKLASLGLLAAGVAHEINGPLTSIVMKSHLLMEELQAYPEAMEELQKIDADAMRCQRIVENLRAFARRGELVMRRGRVADVVAHAVAATTQDLQARGTRVGAQLPPDLPDVVWDPDRMSQVLIHLILNAAQALERGGRITVTASMTGGELALAVTDTGPGIPAGHRARIFDPFFTTRANGTGLGLSICHGIVSEHRGRLDVESRCAGDDGVGEHDTGTTITVTVPLDAEIGQAA